MERVKTGIKGLDAMLNGGIPNRHHVLICGGPGTGKTMLGLEFLYHGAKAGEPGLFITLEELPSRIIDNAIATFPGWKDFNKLIDQKAISIVKPDKFI